MPYPQVERYAKTFWEKGSTAFAAADWERHVKSVEKGERKIEEITRCVSHNWLASCEVFAPNSYLCFYFLPYTLKNSAFISRRQMPFLSCVRACETAMSSRCSGAFVPKC